MRSKWGGGERREERRRTYETLSPSFKSDALVILGVVSGGVVVLL